MHMYHEIVFVENGNLKIDKGLKILKKNIIFEKNYWKIVASHDGYIKDYGVIHERQIEFFPEANKFIGNDKLLKNAIDNGISSL